MNKLLLAATLLISLQSFSQVQSFVFGGIQGNNVRYVIHDSKQSSSFKIGGHAGFGLKVPFEGRLSFVPLVFYSLKGYEVKFDHEKECGSNSYCIIS